MGVSLLVVEDDPDLRSLLSRGLSAEGYDVALAHDGAGLGLALSRRLARTVGGDVKALSTIDGAHLQAALPAV